MKKTEKKYKRRSLAMTTMTKFVVVVLINVNAFTITCLVANFCGKEIQEALINGFFSVFTGELVGLLLKKILDNLFVKKKKKAAETVTEETEESEESEDET